MGNGSINRCLFTGAVDGDPFWDGVRDAVLAVPSNETQECQRPKPILIPTGEVKELLLLGGNCFQL